MNIEQRLAALGITLPRTPPPTANFVPTVQTGDLLFVSGHTSIWIEGSVQGKVGQDVSLEEAYTAARRVAVSLLGTVQDTLGDLNRVTRVVKLLGMVNSAPNFGEHGKVINGASDLLVEIFGERGRHARSAVGMAQLPGSAAVEIEMILEVE
ncbi:RidA family protein [Deinococcus oregonensis]|uniref:RidA family protein n=1 Tax=Deinococcus oregonensis TaxID=1805970 RepID=A0ABV6AZJ0_9DEIO